jgi:hypothetical protein
MTRTPLAARTIAVALTGVLALSACAPPTGDAPPPDDARPALDLVAEAETVAALGVESGLSAAAAPDQSAGGKAGAENAAGENAAGEKAGGEKAGGEKAGDRRGRKAGAIRRLLRGNGLHGEVTVQGRKGVRTIAAQRGTVTAVTATAVTVKSADGFTATWTFGDKLRVRQDRRDAERSAVRAGVEVAVAGARDGDTRTARLIVLR